MCVMRSISLLILALLVACSPAAEDATTEGVAAEESRAAETAAQNVAAEETTSITGNATLNVQETALEYRSRQRQEPAVSVEGSEALRHTVACVTCHGFKGGGDLALHTPRIGGLEGWYIARQLKLFHRGLRGGTEDDVYGTYMRSSILLLDNAGIEEVAEHFAALDPEPMPKVVEGNIDRGKEIYVVCSGCHGEQAMGDPALNTPALIGQSGPYMVRQLEHFRTGLRGSDPADVFGQQMAPVVRNTLTSRQDSVDVVAYIESLSNEQDAAGEETASEGTN